MVPEHCEEYVGDFVTSLLASFQDRLRESIQPPVNVDVTLSSLQGKLQTLFTGAMIKSLNDLEQRFRVYAERCMPMVETHQFKKIKRSISRSERQVMKNFSGGEKEIFGRKLARSHRHREALKACFHDLTRDLNLPGSSLLDVLHEKHVMSTSDLDSIRAGRHPRKVNEEFLLHVCGKLTLDDFNNVFLPTLNEDHPHLCARLVEEMDRVEEETTLCISCRVRNDVQVKSLAAPLFRSKAISLSLYSDLTGAGLSNSVKWAELEKQSISHEAIIESLEGKYPDFHQEFKAWRRNTLVCFCSNIGASETVVDDRDRGRDESDVVTSDICSHVSVLDDEKGISELLMSFQSQNTTRDYKMKHTNRGVCLIINTVPTKRSIYASKMDNKRLEATFKRLGFEVISKSNQTADEIMSLVREYSKETHHSNADAFVCCLLSHGEKEDSIRGRDGEYIEVSDITSQFTASKCPSLAGKPKLFFMNTSRGTHMMKGHTIPSSQSDPASGDGTCESQDSIAEEADFLIGYGTTRGYCSFRFAERGSWYITALCDVLDSHADDNDLLSCLLMVNDQMARTTHKTLDRRMVTQVPAPVVTLRKKVHLTVDPRFVPPSLSTDGANRGIETRKHDRL